MLYVTDAQSNDATNPDFKRGIRIGSAKTGVVTAFIPIVYPDTPTPQGTGRESNFHAADLSAWLKVLGGDDRAIFTASSKATAAIAYLEALSLASVRQSLDQP